MLGRKAREDKVNKYIRQRILQLRNDTHQPQEDLAKTLEKSRVAVSDIERGRVAVSAADLALIAHHFGKPVSFFYPPIVKIDGSLSPMEEELLVEFAKLPDEQQYIALEYINHLAEIAEKAFDRARKDDSARIRAESKR